MSNRTDCGTRDHFHRRTLFKAAGAASALWLTPVAEQLARAAESQPRGTGAKSIFMLWMQGGPSQRETFEPKPGAAISYGTEAIDTAVPGIQLAKGLEPLAEIMQDISIVRSVTSKEGDHERAVYNGKTGFRPDPTLVHPSLGAVACSMLHDNVEIPRHVSILPGPFPARGGYLGDQYDAFKIYDQRKGIPDVTKRVSDERFKSRAKDLEILEANFQRRRIIRMNENKTLHETSIQAALKMMSSEQLKAFDVAEVPESERAPFGDHPFGRGCLAAARLIEVGVRCVEVTLNGWDTHANNHAGCKIQTDILGPAYASLIKYLKQRDLLKHTVVICGGEFGRTPRLNGIEGRDHWPHGFSICLSGGGIQGGRVVGETSPEPKMEKEHWDQNVADPHNVADIHATVLHALGIDFKRELQTPIQRPMIISQGSVIEELLA
mgnify:CR=1 FL=1